VHSDHHLENTSPTIYTVRELTERLRNHIRSVPDFLDVWVRGEVSNYRHHTSGHVYFTLKDENAVLPCVLFRERAERVKFEMREGLEVIVRGEIEVYIPGGKYNLLVREIEVAGIGALYIRFQELKSKLEKEGLFSPEHKKPLPPFPKTIGVVTSPTGAALQDILRVLRRRYPLATILLSPAQVQGEGASDTLVKALKLLEAEGSADVIIIGRGGGSIEDLWPFNEERVARAIYECSIPIISAVGHETDFTIADFVADKRAPTPSAAAEIVAPSIDEIRMLLSALKERMQNALTGLGYQYQMLLDEMLSSMKNVMLRKVNLMRERVDGLALGLRSLSPMHTLGRGFALVHKLPEGTIVDSVKKVVEGDRLEIRLKDGEIICRVEEV